MDSNNENTPERYPERKPEDIGDPSLDELKDIVLGPSASEVLAAEEIFREGLIPATQKIVHIAAYGSTERIALDAAKYVVERNLGKVTDKLKDADRWEELLKEITPQENG